MKPETIQVLRRFDAGLCVKVSAFEGLAPLLAAYADNGLDVAVWLLLPPEQGYWPSERNAALFAAQVDRLLLWADRAGVNVPWLAVDLERPLSQTRSLSGSQGLARALAEARLAALNLDRKRFARARAIYRSLAVRVHDAGSRLLCAAHDYLVTDLMAGSDLLQDVNEAPVAAVPWDVVSLMLYTSLVPRGATRWLYDAALTLCQALGDRAGASIGLTGPGVLGSEPHYAEPSQLAPDVAALKAAGVQDIAIYNLEGILASADPAAWLQLVRETPAAIPRPTAWSRRQRLKRLLLAGTLRLLAPAGRREGCSVSPDHR